MRTIQQALARRNEVVEQSEIRQMSIECERVNGLNLSQGLCDLPTPQAVLAGAREAMGKGENNYTRYDGIKPLRDALAMKLKRDNAITADPDTEIIVSAGSTGALYAACLALLNPGDEVIVFEPSYGYHLQTLRAVDAVAVPVRLRDPDWTFTLADLEKAATARTRGIIVNTPANPCGKVFSRADLDVLAAFANAHDLVVFTDEIYEYVLYDGRTHLSPGSLPALKDRTVTISGVSKTFSVTGWRIGYAVCNREWAKAIGYMSDLVYVCAPAPLQWGVAKGLTDLGPDYYRGLTHEFTARRERMCASLTRAKLTPRIPEGAYYVLADISRLPGKTSKERAMGLLAKTGIACVPGEAFFANPAHGHHLARFCFAVPDATLDLACRRLDALT